MFIGRWDFFGVWVGAGAAIRIANSLNAEETASSAVARNMFILLRQAIERGGLPLTATFHAPGSPRCAS